MKDENIETAVRAAGYGRSVFQHLVAVREADRTKYATLDAQATGVDGFNSDRREGFPIHGQAKRECRAYHAASVFES